MAPVIKAGLDAGTDHDAEPQSYPVTALCAPFLAPSDSPFLAHLAPTASPSTLEPIVLSGSLVSKPAVSLRALLDSGAGLDAVSDAFACAHGLVRQPLPQVAQARLPNAATLPLSHFVELPVLFDGQSGDVQAEPATTPSRGKNNKNRERTNWTSLRASVRTRAVSWRQAQPAYIQFPAAFSGQATSPTLDRGELSELDGHGGISVIAATALMAWICQATGLSISCRPRDDGRHVLSPTWAWQLHSAWESGPSDLVACAARCVRKCWTAQPFRITELFLLALLPAHGSNCGHFIAARYKFDSTSAITIWDSLRGDSTSPSGENFLSDTYFPCVRPNVTAMKNT